jgi:DNA-binding LytR/AlgR family response regulator
MLKCIVVDDEEMAIKVIRSHIANIKELEVTGTYNNAIEAFAVLQQQVIDLVFLDIQMPKMTGLTLIRSLSKPPNIILTTAHREFALESYDLNVIDYLLKPISFERFMKAVGKVFQLEKVLQTAAESSGTQYLNKVEAPFIYIKSDRQFTKILLDEILYIESIKNHVKITTQRETLVTIMTISEMEEKLPPQRFLRIHRSYIAAVSKIEKFTHAAVTISKQELPVGEFYKVEVLKRLQQNLI